MGVRVLVGRGIMITGRARAVFVLLRCPMVHVLSLSPANRIKSSSTTPANASPPTSTSPVLAANVPPPNTSTTEPASTASTVKSPLIAQNVLVLMDTTKLVGIVNNVK